MLMCRQISEKYLWKKGDMTAQGPRPRESTIKQERKDDKIKTY